MIYLLAIWLIQLVLIVLAFLIHLFREKDRLGDEDVDYDWKHDWEDGIMVIHGGKNIILTRYQKEFIWDNMSKREKDAMIANNKVKEASTRPMTFSEHKASVSMDKYSGDKSKRERYIC
jgi:hypothetical protein